MFTQIIKTAKNIIAKNEAKKLLEYFKNEATNGLTNDQIQLLRQKIVTIQKQSFNFPWFVHRFIQQKKHYQDIQDLLKVQQAYKKLNKELRTFQFYDNNTFSDFNNFMENYLNKNAKNQEFKAPSHCELIHSDSKYNYYYADANDTKCYEDLHECNTKQDGQQYAQWCVVNGSVDWGRYTTPQFQFYVYVTYKNNIPVMLFNFGYDWDCQIKDIHNDPFTKYDQELLTGIKQLAKKYNFNIAKNEDDFQTFNEVDKLYNKQLDELNIDQNIISQSQKYNGLNFIQQNIIYDFKKNKKAYLIANDNLINLSNYKIDINVLNLLKDSGQYSCIYQLTKGKFIEHCSDVVSKFIIDLLIQNKRYNQLYHLICNDKIKDEKPLEQIIQLLIQNKRRDQLYYLIYNDKIKNEKVFNQIIQLLIQNEEYFYLSQLIRDDKIKVEKVNYIIQCMIQNKKYDYLYQLIQDDKIKDEKVINQAAQYFIQNKKYRMLYSLINSDKIKDEKLFNQIIQLFIQNKRDDQLRDLIRNIKDEKSINWLIQLFIQNKQYRMLYSLIFNAKIKDEKLFNQIIQLFIQNKSFAWLGYLIELGKIQDEKLFNQIIQLFIQNEQYYQLYQLIEHDKIKYENAIHQIIKCFIQNKQYDHLSSLIYYSKIKDEKLINQLVPFFIQNKRYYQLHTLEITYPELIKKIKDAKNSSNVKVSHICRELLDIAKSISK